MANQEAVDVIVQVDTTAKLMDAAYAALTGQISTPPPIDTSSLPAGFVLDTNFAPVPVTGPMARRVMMGIRDDMSPGSVILRGQIAREDFPRAREQGVGRLFADPYVEAMPTTCAATPPVGAKSDVERLLDCTRLHHNGMDGNNVAIAIVDSGINLAHLASIA